jgi:protein-S-isoprenylcysteine O-methyltransferase Ste14
MPWFTKCAAQLSDFVTARRVALSAVLFTALLCQDLWSGQRPHDVTNWRDLHTVLGLSLILVGLALRSWAVGIVRKNQRLTTTGPYRVVRNPLYVGSFLMMFGFCALIDDPQNIWFVLGPMLWLYYLKVRKEEKHLAATFGKAWEAYSRRTPRVFPRMRRVCLTAQWSFGRWLLSREYRAALTSLVACVALKVWHIYY